MTQTQSVLAAMALTVVILSVLPAICATESPEADASEEAIGKPFAPS